MSEDPKDQSTEEQSKPNEAEERARRQGWRPKDEFKGPGEAWVDADEFLRRGEEVVPILKERSKRMEAELSELRRTMQEFQKHHEKVKQSEYDRAYAAIKEEMRKATTFSDQSAFDAAEKKMDALQKQIFEERQQQQAANPENDPVIQSWIKENPWFVSDPMLAREAQGIAQGLANLGYSKELQLSETSKRIKKLFPEKFGEATPPAKGAAPSTSGEEKRPGKKGKAFSDLPKEAQEVAILFERKGIMKRDEYIKEYFDSSKSEEA